MNNVLEHITEGFQTIQSVGNCTSTENELFSLLNVKDDCVHSVDRDSFLYHSKHQSQRGSETTADLVVINLDSFGVKDTLYLLFIAMILRPTVPVVLITKKVVTDDIRSSLLSSGALEVVQLAGTAKSRVVSA